MDKYVCPPAYSCRCRPRFKAVGRTTMLEHRRIANARRAADGLSPLAWGPRYVEDASYLSEWIQKDMEDLEALCREGTSSPKSGSEATDLGQQGVVDQMEMDTHHGGIEADGPTVPGSCKDVDHEANMHGSPLEVTETLGMTGDDEEVDYEEIGRLSPAEGTFNVLVPPDLSTSTESMDTSEDELEHNGPQSSDAEVYESKFRLWATQQRSWVDLFYKHGLEVSVMDDILKKIDCPWKSWKTIVANICRETSVGKSVQKYGVCKGHMCYVQLKGSDNQIFGSRCCECGSLKPTEISSASPAFYYLPIMDRIAEIVADEARCKQLYSYTRSKESPENRLDDFFDSAAYRRISELYGGGENMAYDVFIAASADGFQAFKNKDYDVWPVAAILYNLPPDQRYLIKNVLPLGFVPGPREPKNLQSFLAPLFNEVKRILEAGGEELTFFDGVTRRVRLHLIWFTGDLPAVAKSAGVVGHNGKTPCRFCTIQGFYSNHYYFPSKIRLEGDLEPTVLYNPEALPRRTVERTLETLDMLGSCSIVERNLMRTDTGVRESSILFGLPTILPFRSFPVDIMHLFYNVSSEMLKLWMGDLHDSFKLSRNSIAKIDEELIQFGWGISGQLGNRPRPLSQFRNWKAAEHKAFVLSYSLVVLDGHLPDEYLSGWADYVELMDLCFQPSLDLDDLELVSELSLNFFGHFEKSYFRFRADRVNLCKYVFHLLLHLRENIEECGPLLSVSQYWMERYIGWIEDRLNSKNLVAESLHRNALFLEAYKAFYREPFTESSHTYNAVWLAGGFKLLGKPRDEGVDSRSSDGKALLRMLVQYFVRKYNTITYKEGKTIVNSMILCKSWQRVRFICGSTTQTAKVAFPLHVPPAVRRRTRASCYIAAEMDATELSADVYYGKLLRLLSFEIPISFSTPAVAMPWNRHHQLAVIQWASGLRVGNQGQVFKKGDSTSAFSAQSVEDISIIKRLIGVVDHEVPAGGDQNSRRPRRLKKRAYFFDDAVRSDRLLDSSRSSSDGINRVLKEASMER